MADIPLKRARELAGLTQAELERRANLQPGAVHDLESGRVANPSWTTVARIVRALKRAGLKGADAEQLFPVPVGKEVA